MESQTRISRFTIGRLYNLGNYEHVRYELTVEVPEGCSVGTAFTRTLKLLKAVSPRSPISESDYERAKLVLAKPSEALTDWDKEQIPHYRERVEAHDKWKRNREKALEALNGLGASVETKDAKLSWDDFDDDDDY